MDAVDKGPSFSGASLSCWKSLPSKVLASSRSVGWTSVLVDRHRVEPSGEPFETLPTPDHTLVVMVRGEQTIEVLRHGSWHSSSYRAGTTGTTWGGDTVRLRRRVRPDSASFEKANLYVPTRFFDEAADHLARPGQRLAARPFRSSPFDDPLIKQTVIALLDGVSAGACDVYAQTAMYWLTMHLLSVHAHPRGGMDDPRRPGSIPDRRLDRVLDFMTSNLEKRLTLEQLAAEAGISKFHFARLFREATGSTPHAFLVRLRVDVAKGMLRTSDMQVAEVAAKCGFNGASHFSAAFAHHVGLSPSRYRDRA